MTTNIHESVFFHWVREQADDRRIDMGESHCRHSCGCVLIQYGRTLPELTNACYTAGQSRLLTTTGNSVTINGDRVWPFILGCIMAEVTTFHQAKAFIPQQTTN